MTVFRSWQILKEYADQVRGVDLEAVLLHVNSHRDPKDKKKWHTPQGTISVTAQKFMNWNRGTGGGGAIDLVMHLKGYRFTEAVNWLLHTFPYVASEEGLLPGGMQETAHKTLRMPQRYDAHIPQIKRYLNVRRCLSLSLATSLIQEGKLYADSKANAVFLLLGKGKKVIGAELVGTGKMSWKGMAPGSDKKHGCFSIKKSESKKVLLCESAIDAISCFIFYPDCIAVSTAGVCSDRPWLQGVINKGYQVFCAFDADMVGDNYADKMILKHPEINRLRPPCKDWNEALQQKGLAPSLSPD